MEIKRPRIIIDGFTIPQYLSFTQRQSISEFQDSITLELGDPVGSLLFDKVNTNKDVQTFIAGVNNTFKIYKLNVSGRNGGSKSLICSGMSSSFESALNDFQPKKFTNVTDNDIISEALEGYSLDLDTAININTFDTNAGESNLDVAKRAASRNGFILYFTDGVVHKKKIPESGCASFTYVDQEISNQGVGIITRVFPDSINIEKNITTVRNTIVGFGNKSDHSLFNDSVEVNPVSIFSGETIDLNRTMYVSIDSRDDSEIKNSLEESKYKAQPVEVLSFDVSGRDQIKLNDIANIKLSQFKINAKMYLFAKQFVDRGSKSTTTLFFAGLGRNFR